jgi:hypothetical protein
MYSFGMDRNGKYRLVYIEWEDSYGCSPDWEDLENCSPAPMVCRSIGWLIHDDKKCKVVVPHLTQADHPNSNLQGCGDMTIPTSAIRKIADVKIADPKTR